MSQHQSDRVIGCEHCGKPVALVGDRILSKFCMWCIAKAAPGAAALYAKGLPR